MAVKDLTMAKAYKIARGMEAVYQQSNELQTAHQEHEAHKVYDAFRSSRWWRCDRTGHMQTNVTVSGKTGLITHLQVLRNAGF